MESSSGKITKGSPVGRAESPPSLSLVALPAAAPRPGPVEVAGRPIWMSDRVVLTDGALGVLPPWFVGWFLSEGRRS